MQTLTVELGERSYPIHIGQGLINRAELILPHLKRKQVAVVNNTTVAPLYLQKLSDAPLTDCPSCGKPELKKLLSAAGFRLKGGGWYETDFKSGKDKKKNLAGEASSTTPSTQSDAAGGSKSSSSSKPSTSASET